MLRKPKDTDERRTGSRARAIVHFTIDSDHWDYKEESGNDVGRDCILELSENNQWGNKKIEGQIKGTRNPRLICDDAYLTVPVETKTIGYALGSPISFVLFYVDVDREIVYFQPLQEYFIEKPELHERLENQATLNIRIPVDNVLRDRDSVLCDLAKYTYIGGMSPDLKRVET